MKELTKAQEEILNAIWKIKKGAASDVLNILPNPKPAYNTVSTVIKVLEKKGYVTHNTYGKTNVYQAIVSKQEYAQYQIKQTLKGLFNGSLNQMVSSFVKNKDISLNELEELKAIIEEEIKNQKE
ncbi:MAG: BlaI/MecI/CopY family transcriptional regulator [Bacteroidales bacterium]|nr:BlaI/MecI/CopY family transcriptional regulator [Bacteroidales bacterium]HPD96617.1 BlaI/MecI/CopY family transcriptional regulator [Tenuifilaceae bacterium]